MEHGTQFSLRTFNNCDVLTSSEHKKKSDLMIAIMYFTGNIFSTLEIDILTFICR